MGTFNCPLRISSMDGQLSRDVVATVDTGAAYTTLPANLLRELGVAPLGKRRLLLADGRRVDMEYGEARAIVNGENVATLVIFGEDDGPPLIGAYTLEGLALAVDPVKQRLVPHAHDHVLAGQPHAGFHVTMACRRGATPRTIQPSGVSSSSSSAAARSRPSASVPSLTPNRRRNCSNAAPRSESSTATSALTIATSGKISRAHSRSSTFGNPGRGVGAEPCTRSKKGTSSAPRCLHHLHEHDAVPGMRLHLRHEGNGVRHLVQHQGAEHHVRRGRLRLFPRLVDDRDVGESGLSSPGFEHFDGVRGRLDDGDVTGPRRQRQRVAVCAPANVEDAGIRPQGGVEGVQHRVVGAIGVQRPAGVPETAPAVPLPMSMTVPMAVSVSAAAQRHRVAFVRYDPFAPGVDYRVHRLHLEEGCE